MNGLLASPELPAGAARPAHGGDAPNAGPSRRVHRTRLVLRGIALVVVVAGAATAVQWGPRALSRLSFFRVRRVEVEGARYASAAELVARVAADTTASVWRDLAPLAARVRSHPLVADATVERRLPGVLVVRIVEKTPIAAVPGAGGLAFYDSAGSRLPVAAAVARDVDVPIAAAPDRDLLRALAALRAEAPHVYARVSEARQVRGPRAELVFALAAPGASTGTGGGASPLVVRAGVDVTPSRFADVALVEGDLARRGVRPVELDVRFRDQVVARLP